MKGPVRVIVLALAVLALVSGAFWGGMWFQESKAPTGPGGFVTSSSDGTGRGFQGGPMANLTEEEQAEFEAMTEEERQAWFQENMGAPGAGGPVRGGNLKGEVIEVAEDTITVSLDSGSQTFYVDEDTVIAYVDGAGTLAAGSQVMVVAEPSTEGVTTATLVVVL